MLLCNSSTSDPFSRLASFRKNWLCLEFSRGDAARIKMGQPVTWLGLFRKFLVCGICGSFSDRSNTPCNESLIYRPSEWLRLVKIRFHSGILIRGSSCLVSTLG